MITKGKWRAEEFGGKVNIMDNNGDVIARTLYRGIAEYIVKCCNKHEEYKEVLTACEELIEHTINLNDCGAEYTGCGKWQSRGLRNSIDKVKKYIKKIKI